MALLSIVGCSSQPEPRSALFERAESHYRRGDYEAALREYQAFRRRFPTSPLSETAKRRMQTIRLEIETVLSSDHSFIPTYTGGNETPRNLRTTSPSDQPPPLPERIENDESPAPNPPAPSGESGQ